MQKHECEKGLQFKRALKAGCCSHQYFTDSLQKEVSLKEIVKKFHALVVKNALSLVCQT